MRRPSTYIPLLLIVHFMLGSMASGQDQTLTETFSGRVAEVRDFDDPIGLTLEEPDPLVLADGAPILEADGTTVLSLETLADSVFVKRSQIRVVVGINSQGSIGALRVLGVEVAAPADLGENEKSFTLFFVNTDHRTLQPTPRPFIEVVATTIDQRGTQIFGEDGIKIALRDLQAGTLVQVTGTHEEDRFLAAEIQVLETVKQFSYEGVIIEIDRETSSRGVVHFQRDDPQAVDARADVIVDGEYVGPGLESIISILETTEDPVTIELSRRDAFEPNGLWGQIDVSVGVSTIGTVWNDDRFAFQLPDDPQEAIRIKGENQGNMIYPRRQAFPVDEFTQIQDWSQDGAELTLADLIPFASVQVNGEIAGGEVTNQVQLSVNEWPEDIDLQLTINGRDSQRDIVVIGFDADQPVRMTLGARFLDPSGTPMDPFQFESFQWQGPEPYVALITLSSDGSGSEASLVPAGTPPGPGQTIVGEFAGKHRGFWVGSDGREIGSQGINGILTSDVAVAGPDGQPISASLLDQGVEAQVAGVMVQGQIFVSAITVLSSFDSFDVTSRIQHVEQGGEWIQFEEADPIMVDPDAQIIDHFGDPASLGFLADLLQQSELQLRLTMDGESPSGGTAASLVEAFRPDASVDVQPGQELVVASRIDPWNFPPMIFLSGVREVSYSDDTTILDQNGNPVGPESLAQGMPVHVVGYSIEREQFNEWDPPRTYLAERIEIVGGVATDYQGTIASLEGGVLTFDPPRPLLITQHTDIREETDFPIDFFTLAQRILTETGLRVHLGADFWSPGHPQVWWVRIMWPDETAPSRMGPDQVVAVLVEADEETRTVTPATDPPFVVTDNTRIVDLSGEALGLEVLVPGSRIAVLAERQNGDLIAVEIKVEEVPQPIAFTAPVEWIDETNRTIFFRVPQFITVAQEAEILNADGDPVSLEQMKQDLFALDYEERMLLVTQDPDSPEDAPIATAVQIMDDDSVQIGEGQFVAIIDDPGYRIGVHDRRIEPAPLPPFGIAEDAELIGMDGAPIDLSDINQGVKIAITGMDTDGNIVINRLEVVGGNTWTGEAVIGFVDVESRLIGPEGEPPIFVDPNAWIGDPERQRINLTILADFIQRDPDLVIAISWNPYGPGVASVELRYQDTIGPDDHGQYLVKADRVAVDPATNQLQLKPDPPATVAEDAEITGPDGEPITLGDLEAGIRIFVRGEDLGQGPIVTHINVIATLVGLQVMPQIGDFDEEGVDNDVMIDVLDQAGGAVELPVRIYLDYRPPVETRSGHVFYSLEPGPHVVSVELPGQNLTARERVFINAFGVAFRVAETLPAAGDTKVPTLTDIAVTFTEPLRQFGDFIAIAGNLNPEPESGSLRLKMALGTDGRTLQFQDVELAEATDYTLSIFSATSKSGVVLGAPVHVHFSTGGELALPGSVAGFVVLTEEVQFIGRIRLFDDEGQQLIESPLDSEGQFGIQAVLAGTYQLSAEAETEDGRFASGFLDRDGDGLPDEVVLAAGESVSGLELLLELPEPETPDAGGSNSAAVIALDLDPRAENQGKDMQQVLPGADIKVSVYASGVSDLVGFNVSLAYDTTAVSLKGVDESAQGEQNLLKIGGGLAVTLPPTVEPGSVEFAGAILGATSQTAANGDGLLGVFRFGVKRDFSAETQFLVPRVQLEGLGGGDELSVLARGAIQPATSRLLLRVSSDKDTLEADGTSTATIKAELKDSEGNAVTEETSVIFQASAGGVLSTSEVVTSGGVAEAELSGVAEGDVTVEVIAGGVSEEITVVILPAVGTGTVGPMALDLDLATGDQGKRKTGSAPSAGDEVILDLVVTDGAQDAAGFEVNISFDSSQLEFVSFSTTDVFAGALAIQTPDGGEVNIGAAMIGGTVSSDAGSMGQVTLRVLDGFAGEARVRLTLGKLGFTSGEKVLQIGSGGAVVVIGGDSDGPNPDFDGDGTIGFTDFIQFAQAYGSNEGESGYDTKFDLDSDGTIGFKDFIEFAQVYGSPAGAKRALSKALSLNGPGANGSAGFALSAARAHGKDEVSVVISLTDAVWIAGYGFTVGYDSGSLAWSGADALQPSQFGRAGQIAIANDHPGEVQISDILDSTAGVSGTADIVRLRFRVLDPSAVTRVEIANVLVSDQTGRVDHLAGYGASEVRAIPRVYSLDANYPNPFNPETTVPYAVPNAGDVKLAVYNALGQRIAVLAQGRRGAGYYRAVWDGRDEIGREVASGIYFVRMSAEGFTAVRKMMVLK